ncbi:MAG: hypothetical protein J7623_03890 [Chitinophaga sp.]|uniref:hypothetical protein n=1 Tax=Chitinophaga sp. TaxID=1869181 RepID=UPI001B01FCC1|nr:hypothetical protein [Chitinophaga sp.]MBO9727764.1 hypothetical protein [Chitinophaga sp.]
MLLSPLLPVNTPARSFGAFVFTDRQNRLLLAIAIAVVIIRMVVFKHFFPYMDFTSDTGSYMTTALQNLDHNLWPLGYSKFLWLFHQVSHSETALAVLQLTLLELSAWFFYFSIVYIFRPDGYFRYGFYAFLLINPLFPFLSNYFISDAVFLSLGLTWITLLLWMLHRPTNFILVLHALVLGLAFTIRYHAMFYPLVALIPILLSKYKKWQKAAAILLPVMLILSFMGFVRQRTYEYTGVREFSVFSGWQLMNNSMYMLQYRKLDSTGVPAQFAHVHKLVYHYCENLRQSSKKKHVWDGAVFMWDNAGPQKTMLGEYSQAHKDADVYTCWANLAPLFRSYGAYTIKKYPVDFARHYLRENAILYLLPEPEVLAAYNRPFMVFDTASVTAFFTDGKIQKPRSKYDELQSTLMALFPSLIVICHLLFLEETIRYLVKKGIRKSSRKFNIALLLCWTFILINFGFSVLAAPIVLRYQVLLIVLLLAYTLLLTGEIDRPAVSKEEAELEEEQIMLGI